MTWTLYGKTLSSRLFLGSARYPSLDNLQQSVIASQASLVTVSLRRAEPHGGSGNRFWEILKELNLPVLPNTAGCRTAREAIATAQLARELFGTRWIKLEVIGYDGNLAPDPFGLVEAARELVRQEFQVFPYMTTDVVVGERLIEAGCEVLMPWGSPIGSGQGLSDPGALRTFRNRFKAIAIVVDAGLGRPSHASQAMELGADAVLVNTAVSQAADPVAMANAFRLAVEAGRLGYTAGAIEPRETAVPSTPVLGTPFWREI